MPDFTNTAGWQVQKLPNLESSGSASPLIGGGKANGLLAQTFDPILANASAPVATGTLVGVLTLITEPIKTSKITMETVSSTVSHAFACIVDLNGNILASTADFNADWAATTEITEAWTAATVLAPGLYYLAVAAVGTTPTIEGLTPSSVAANANTSGTAGNLRCATLATGITTAVPASPLTLTSATAVASAPWLGLL